MYVIYLYKSDFLITGIIGNILVSRFCKDIIFYNILKRLIVQGIFAKIGPDLELRGGDLISSPVDSIVSLVSPKKSYGPNSVGKNYFSATPFSLLAKNATGGHNA